MGCVSQTASNVFRGYYPDSRSSMAKCFCMHQEDAELQELYLDFHNLNQDTVAGEDDNASCMQINAQEYGEKADSSESSSGDGSGLEGTDITISTRCMAPLSPHKKCKRKCNQTLSNPSAMAVADRRNASRVSNSTHSGKHTRDCDSDVSPNAPRPR